MPISEQHYLVISRTVRPGPATAGRKRPARHGAQLLGRKHTPLPGPATAVRKRPARLEDVPHSQVSRIIAIINVSLPRLKRGFLTMTSAQAARYLRLLGVSVRRPDLGTYLGGIERHGFGGTCYANNHYFLFVARFCPNGGVIIRNFHRSVVQDGSTEAHDLPSRDDVIRAITADFGMPGEIVRPIVIDLLASDHH